MTGVGITFSTVAPVKEIAVRREKGEKRGKANKMILDARKLIKRQRRGRGDWKG